MNKAKRLDQARTFKAGVAVLADDDVAVDSDPERLGCVDDHLRRVDVGA